MNDRAIRMMAEELARLPQFNMEGIMCVIKKHVELPRTAEDKGHGVRVDGEGSKIEDCTFDNDVSEPTLTTEVSVLDANLHKTIQELDVVRRDIADLVGKINSLVLNGRNYKTRLDKLESKDV